MATIDYNGLAAILNGIYDEVNDDGFNISNVPLPAKVDDRLDPIFRSRTQSYREALLGCALVRYADKTIDLTKPYVKHGTNAYNGRTLDETVINPFFQKNEIPSSKNVYLATFRRGVMFDMTIEPDQKDKPGYRAFLSCLDYLASVTDDQEIADFIRHILCGSYK